MSQNISQLFTTGVDNGVITQETVEALQVVGIDRLIQGGTGISPDDVDATEVTLVSLLMDDSGSMSQNTGVAIAGHNLVLDALAGGKGNDGVLFGSTLLNGGQISPFNKLGQSIRLSKQNYSAGGGTPLHKQALGVLATVLEKTNEFFDNGVPVRSITVFVTDGENTDGIPASKVKTVVEDMIKSEMHIVIGVGIGDEVSFKQAFAKMGIRPEWMLTPGNSESEIRKAFQVVSQSAVKVSQSAGGSFTQAALGGFGA